MCGNLQDEGNKYSAVEHNVHPDTSLRSFLVLCAWKRLLRWTLKTPSELQRSPRTPQATQKNSQHSHSHSHHALKHNTACVSTNLSTYKHTPEINKHVKQHTVTQPGRSAGVRSTYLCLLFEYKRSFCECG